MEYENNLYIKLKKYRTRAMSSVQTFSFLGAAYAAPALHMQRPEKLNFLQNYKKSFFQLQLRKKVA